MIGDEDPNIIYFLNKSVGTQLIMPGGMLKESRHRRHIDDLVERGEDETCFLTFILLLLHFVSNSKIFCRKVYNVTSLSLYSTLI